MNPKLVLAGYVLTSATGLVLYEKTRSDFSYQRLRDCLQTKIAVGEMMKKMVDEKMVPKSVYDSVVSIKSFDCIAKDWTKIDF